MCQPLANGVVCATCGRKFYKGEGRRLNLSDDQIESIIKNFHSTIQEQTQKNFCKTIGISPYTYRSIVYGRIKNAKDKERIDKIAASIKNSIVWKDAQETTRS